MTDDELAAIVAGLAPVVRAYVAQILAPVTRDLGQLGERLLILEAARPADLPSGTAEDLRLTLDAPDPSCRPN